MIFFTRIKIFYRSNRKYPVKSLPLSMQIYPQRIEKNLLRITLKILTHTNCTARAAFSGIKRTQENYDSAEANYKKAIDLDPDYALAYAGLADCYTFNQKGLPQLEAVPIASAYADKAIATGQYIC